jgi:hypothetical protein
MKRELLPFRGIQGLPQKPLTPKNTRCPFEVTASQVVSLVIGLSMGRIISASANGPVLKLESYSRVEEWLYKAAMEWILPANAFQY